VIAGTRRLAMRSLAFAAAAEGRSRPAVSAVIALAPELPFFLRPVPILALAAAGAIAEFALGLPARAPRPWLLGLTLACRLRGFGLRDFARRRGGLARPRFCGLPSFAAPSRAGLLGLRAGILPFGASFAFGRGMIPGLVEEQSLVLGPDIGSLAAPAPSSALSSSLPACRGLAFRFGARLSLRGARTLLGVGPRFVGPGGGPGAFSHGSATIALGIGELQYGQTQYDFPRFT
jgi:hypothetical protein